MTRCCMCRARENLVDTTWPFPADTVRCADADACAQRVREIVTAHRDWAAMVAP